MSRLDVTIRGLRVEEGSRRKEPRRGLLEAFAVLVLAALATGYSRGRMAPVAALGTIADFGDRAVGAQGPAQKLVLHNAGRTPLRIDKVSVVGDLEPAFFLPEDSCSHALLGSGETCDVEVAFLPRREGPSRATLVVEDNSADSPHHVVLGGTGLPVSPPPPQQALPGIEPAQVALSTDVGSVASQVVNVTNRGEAPLGLVEVSFSGDRGDFAVDPAGCAIGVVAPGESCPLTVSFAPLHEGAQTATLAVAHDAPSGLLLVSLLGQGNGPPEGFCCVAEQIVAMNAVACAERKGEFALDSAALAGRCAPPDTTPPPAPEKLAPGVPYENDPQGIDCAAVRLVWSPVKDPSEPLAYVVTLENGRGKAGENRPTDWGEVRQQSVDGTELDASPWIAAVLSPTPEDPRAVVAPPTAGAIADRRFNRARRFTPLLVSFPWFRWRVSAKDAAGNQGPPTDWVYFSCQAQIR